MSAAADLAARNPVAPPAGRPPTFSILTPTYDPTPALLRAAVASVTAQTYSRWQLCLVDDGSTRAGTRELLDAFAAADPRIRVFHRPANAGIVAATNDAFAMATGEWVTFLDHDDMLTPHALAALAGALAEHPDADVLYTDEDKIDESGRVIDRMIKPGWSPDLLLGCMYLGHLTAYRSRLVAEIGGLRPGFDGSQDWDLALRVTRGTSAIHHVPMIGYHWRAAERSTARHAAVKPYAARAGERAIADRLAADGVAATVSESRVPGWFHVRRELTATPLVSVILPTAGTRRVVHGREVSLVRNALHGLAARTDYPALEVIVLISEQAPATLEAELAGLAGPPRTVVRTEGTFNFAATINAGAARARGEFLLLLNDDIEPIDPDWLTVMVSHGQRDGIGVVGAKLVYEDGRIQHAGVVHNESLPVHLRRLSPDLPGPCGSLILTWDFQAVTGACLLTPSAVFAEVGGLSTDFPLNFNDIDYCLKVYATGRRVLLDPLARLCHYESATRDPAVHAEEIELFLTHWRELAGEDPFAAPELAALGIPRPAPVLAVG